MLSYWCAFYFDGTLHFTFIAIAFNAIWTEEEEKFTFDITIFKYPSTSTSTDLISHEVCRSIWQTPQARFGIPFLVENSKTCFNVTVFSLKFHLKINKKNRKQQITSQSVSSAALSSWLQWKWQLFQIWFLFWWIMSSLLCNTRFTKQTFRIKNTKTKIQKRKNLGTYLKAYLMSCSILPEFVTIRDQKIFYLTLFSGFHWINSILVRLDAH